MRLVIPTLALVGAGSVVGCASAAGSPSAPGAERFTLSGRLGDAEGLILAASSVVGVQSPDDVPGVDVYLSLAMVVQLRGPGTEGSFCSKGSSFAQLEDIPADAASCEWSYASLGANAAHTESEHAGDGYLLRDRAGSLHRLLVIDDAVQTGGAATVTFEVAPVD